MTDESGYIYSPINYYLDVQIDGYEPPDALTLVFNGTTYTCTKVESDD